MNCFLYRLILLVYRFGSRSPGWSSKVEASSAAAWPRFIRMTLKYWPEYKSNVRLHSAISTLLQLPLPPSQDQSAYLAIVPGDHTSQSGCEPPKGGKELGKWWAVAAAVGCRIAARIADSSRITILLDAHVQLLCKFSSGA